MGTAGMVTADPGARMLLCHVAAPSAAGMRTTYTTNPCAASGEGLRGGPGVHHPRHEPVRDVVHEDAEAFDRAHAEKDEVPGLGEDDLVVRFFGFRTTTETWSVLTRGACVLATRSTRRRRSLGSECGSRLDSARPCRRAECPGRRRALAPDQVTERADAAEREGEDHVGHEPDAPLARILPHPERDETQRAREIHERGPGGGVRQHEPEEADVAVLVDDVGIEPRESDQHDGQSQLLRVHGSLLWAWSVHR